MTREGVMCLLCHTDVFVHPSNEKVLSGGSGNDICNCGNCGIIQDCDMTLNIYVEDIRTIRFCTYTFNSRGSVVLVQWNTTSGGFKYLDYSQVRNSVYTFEDKKVYRHVPRSKRYDRDLLSALESHIDRQG